MTRFKIFNLNCLSATKSATVCLNHQATLAWSSRSASAGKMPGNGPDTWPSDTLGPEKLAVQESMWEWKSKSPPPSTEASVTGGNLFGNLKGGTTSREASGAVSRCSQTAHDPLWFYICLCSPSELTRLLLWCQL